MEILFPGLLKKCVWLVFQVRVLLLTGAPKVEGKVIFALKKAIF